MRKELPPHRLATAAKTIKYAAEEEFEFDNAVSRKVFDFLVGAFIEDHIRKDVYAEAAGWRSLPQVIKEGKAPWSSIYGSKGKRGRAIGELLNRGLIESKTFPHVPGRGGTSVRLRIAYSKEVVRRHVETRIRQRNVQTL